MHTQTMTTERDAATRPSDPLDHDGIVRADTVIVGGGQAGLAMGYHLSRRDLPFVILDARDRIGDAWRTRWDSLRLFTPAWLDALPGMPFPAPPDAFPTKDEMADYLEGYARRFDLPVRTGHRVERVRRLGDGFSVRTQRATYHADQVVIAMATYQRPKVPAFADELDTDIVQLHVRDYRNPGQLRDGTTLIVGAGNSGAELAMELARRHRVLLSGRHPGHLPFRIDGPAGRALLVRAVTRFVFHRLLTTRTPPGRAVRPNALRRAGPLIRQKPRDLAAAGVTRVPRTTGVSHGRPLLADGRTLDVANVLWCTGFEPDLSWIDAPGVVDGEKEPRHHRGVVAEAPGLYFLGLHFLHALSSAMIHGLDRDAAYLADHVAARCARRAPTRRPA
jgi:putative flavoprotein involved in K+ transport